jgi:hypothetical protein
MTIPSPVLPGVIQSLVDRWLDSPPKDPGLVEAVRSNGALPVYADIGGTLLLRPDGEILALDHGSRTAPQIEADPGWRITAVVVGAEKYPELRRLLPVRPPGTENCQWCEGRGRVRIGEIDRGPLCGNCYGLGWLGGTL